MLDGSRSDAARTAARPRLRSARAHAGRVSTADGPRAPRDSRGRAEQERTHTRRTCGPPHGAQGKTCREKKMPDARHRRAAHARTPHTRSAAQCGARGAVCAPPNAHGQRRNTHAPEHVRARFGSRANGKAGGRDARGVRVRCGAARRGRQRLRLGGGGGTQCDRGAHAISRRAGAGAGARCDDYEVCSDDGRRQNCGPWSVRPVRPPTVVPRYARGARRARRAHATRASALRPRTRTARPEHGRLLARRG
jgi:hypothetical protein